jgi:hypothetical protein
MLSPSFADIWKRPENMGVCNRLTVYPSERSRRGRDDYLARSNELLVKSAASRFASA